MSEISCWKIEHGEDAAVLEKEALDGVMEIIQHWYDCAYAREQAEKEEEKGE